MFLSHTLLHCNPLSSSLFSPPASPPTLHFRLLHPSLSAFPLSPLFCCLLSHIHHHSFSFSPPRSHLFTYRTFKPFLAHKKRFALLSSSSWPRLRCPSSVSPFLYHPSFSFSPSCLSTFSPVVPRRSGHPAPRLLPTTSAAPPCQTVPISPEGWASAARSTQVSSVVPGTSMAPPTPAGLLLHHCRMATARPEEHMAPRGFSASSHPSLYASE